MSKSLLLSMIAFITCMLGGCIVVSCYASGSANATAFCIFGSAILTAAITLTTFSDIRSGGSCRIFIPSILLVSAVLCVCTHHFVQWKFSRRRAESINDVCRQAVTDFSVLASDPSIAKIRRYRHFEDRVNQFHEELATSLRKAKNSEVRMESLEVFLALNTNQSVFFLGKPDTEIQERELTKRFNEALAQLHATAKEAELPSVLSCVQRLEFRFEEPN